MKPYCPLILGAVVLQARNRQAGRRHRRQRVVETATGHLVEIVRRRAETGVDEAALILAYLGELLGMLVLLLDGALPDEE